MEKETLNGFEIFEDFMPGGNVKNNTRTGDKDDIDNIDIDAAAETLTDEELEKLRQKPVDKQDDVDDDDDDNQEPEPTKSKKNKKEKDTESEPDDKDDDTDDNDDVDNEPSEGNAVSAFFEAMSEKMGWELDEDDEIPSTPEELVDYFQSVIEENSVPRYASEEVEALDNFVKNGGNLRDYFEIDGELDLEEISIEDNEINQKLVLKEFLKEKGFSSKQIEKKLTKYEDAGLLEDESEDALEALKEIREQKKQQLLKDQENQAKAAAKRQQEYFQSVVTEIKGMDNIRGIKIPEKDKQVLLEYIFKPDADGMTKFQKDWSKSVKNLLESAYFTMKGDTLLKAAKSEGSTKAINKFKDSLNKTGVSRKTKKQEISNDTDIWSSAARMLRAN
jgi:hypothetical protein